MILIGTYQLLAFAADVSLLGDNKDAIQKNTELYSTLVRGLV
jgi:hypothetical protein